MAKRHWESRRYRISANVNGTRAINSKPCRSMEEAFENLMTKVTKFHADVRAVESIQMVVGMLMNPESTEYGIARHEHPALRELAKRFTHVSVTVSDHGIS